MVNLVDHCNMAVTERRRHEEVLQSLKDNINTLRASEKSISNPIERPSIAEENLRKYLLGDTSKDEFKQSTLVKRDVLDQVKRIRDEIQLFNEQLPKTTREIRNTDLNISNIRRKVWDRIFKSLCDSVMEKAADDLQRVFIAAKLRNGGHTSNIWLEAFSNLWGQQTLDSQGPSENCIADVKAELLKRFIGDSPLGV